MTFAWHNGSLLPVKVAASTFEYIGHLTLNDADIAVTVHTTGLWVGRRGRAIDLQYWGIQTHGLCSPARRDWVLAVLLVANRLLDGPLTLPREMWYAILGAIRRCELGPDRTLMPL